jgi:hypothetical protein
VPSSSATTGGSTGQPYMLDLGDGMQAIVGAKREMFPDGGRFEGVVRPERSPAVDDLREVATSGGGTTAAAGRDARSCPRADARPRRRACRAAAPPPASAGSGGACTARLARRGSPRIAGSRTPAVVGGSEEVRAPATAAGLAHPTATTRRHAPPFMTRPSTPRRSPSLPCSTLNAAVPCRSPGSAAIAHVLLLATASLTACAAIIRR